MCPSKITEQNELSLAQENAALHKEVAVLKEELALLQEQLMWLKKQVFGRKTEQTSFIMEDSRQMTLFEYSALVEHLVRFKLNSTVANC